MSGLMAALYLNSYALTLNGDVSLFQMRNAAVDRTRAELRRLTGADVFVEDEHAYAYREPANVETEIITEPLIPPDSLRLWAAREALVEHCQGLGAEAWFGFGGELHVLGLTPPAIEDRFRIDHVLVLRVSREAYVDAHALLTARHRTQWRTVDPISVADVRARAGGRTAVRMRGDGPRRGRILRVDSTRMALALGDDEIEVSADDYQLAVTGSMVAEWRGVPVLRRLRVTTGELTVSGQRNRHGVEDRFKLVGDAVRRLGNIIAVRGGGEVAVDRLPIAIRLEDAR